MPLKIENFEIINRIIDANINRAKEGLRVAEEVTRFILNDKTLTLKLKNARHEIDAIFKRAKKDDLLLARDSIKDVGKDISQGELKRRDYNDIFFANIQRAKESVRVLEEFSNITNAKKALNFKKIRYQIYEIERACALKLNDPTRSCKK